VQARNIVIEDRFADGQLDRLPSMVTELVERHVAQGWAGFDPKPSKEGVRFTFPGGSRP
jgi:hypothetical protein